MDQPQHTDEGMCGHANVTLAWKAAETDLVSGAQSSPKIRGAFLSKQDRNILSLVRKYLTREIGVYGPKMVFHILNL